jgi:hypothetical protein
MVIPGLEHCSFAVLGEFDFYFEIPLANSEKDEVFHVRQAQVYCSGDFQTWDPKITTPPGLYVSISIDIPG